MLLVKEHPAYIGDVYTELVIFYLKSQNVEQALEMMQSILR